ncbi:Eco57I restriction-modification methylase domain-containing protein [Flagellimonas sp.]|uniref:Eco57I restriction-modification methylase domain-containing protein n=1 Tax=Flagellimonas sp. TaxID=2058762 RepID=UPI003BAC9F8A
MGLFQNSVLNKYLKGLESVKVTQAYEQFTRHFHNPTIQENIRNSKEEQYQGEFLIDLFVNVLGYIKNPTPDFNLTTELKNIKGSKKTDGAILKGEKVLAVIELKGTNTTDLSKVETQAFGYKNNQPGCNYVITSNFEKLRFYIDNAVDFEEFNLFQLSKERFDILWLCLSSEYLLKDIPKKIKDESLTQEENVTKKLYKDYASFRNEIFNAITKENPEYDKLTLFKKTQKLLDRFLFIFFAEDRLLLPPNSIRSIVNQWADLRDKYDEYFPLYDRFKKYFGYMNTGHKGQQHDIFAYNGGLFAPDEILDNIKINDDLLHKHTVNLSNYDFESEVSVNILGHIFEHSLNDIDEIQAEIQGVSSDQSKTKRKKDGVFYTPKYITKYIVDNTVGKLCEEKKTELDIQEAEYEKERKGRQKATIKKLSQKLEDYRKWLLQITICDPACGSGAFLNQALEFLIAEHQYIDELQAKLFGDAMVLSEVENAILENNIYGVDINEESIEIAKLSLWLRTAQKGRKLTSLNKNIKCGNSLIDDPNVAGEKAFNWQNEFPEVFAKGGFDVVIGNPPYVRQELVKHYTEALKSYQVFSGKSDLYTFFFEKGNDILKEKGYLSFISSGKFFEASYGKTLVDFLITNFIFHEVINFDDLEVFKGISAYPLIFTGKKEEINQDYDFKFCYVPDLQFTSLNEIVVNMPFSEVSIMDFKKNGYKFFNKKVSQIFKKINSNSIYLSDLNCLPLVGIKTGYNEGFSTRTSTENSKPYIFGKNLKKYQKPQSETDIIFPYKKENDKYVLLSENELHQSLVILESHKERLVKRAIIKDGVTKGTKSWYEYQQINRLVDFDKEYIVYPNVSLGNNFTLSKGNVIDMTGFIIPSKDKLLLALLNSKITEFVMKKTAITRRGGYQEYKVQYLEKIPLKEVSKKDKFRIVEIVNIIFNLNEAFNTIDRAFLNLISSKFLIETTSRKLQNWYELDFGDFLKELEKARKKSAKENETEYSKLSLSEEAEWMQYFNEQKQKAAELKTEIDKTDKEIDAMVYKLYGLTDEEIAIIEEATK